MNKEEIKLLNEIKSIEDIIMVQADKGGKIAVMNKSDYIYKVEEKLNDDSVYEQLVKKNSTTKLKKKLQQKSCKIRLNTKCYGSSIDDLPKIRSQPKLHKINTPIRIVRCSRNIITPSIPQFIFQFIKQLRSTLKGVPSNTFNFVKEIANLDVDQGE